MFILGILSLIQTILGWSLYFLIKAFTLSAHKFEVWSSKQGSFGIEKFLKYNRTTYWNHGTLIRTGKTCKEITCMRIIVENAEIFRKHAKNGWIFARAKKL